jgi:hypothetical protein
LQSLRQAPCRIAIRIDHVLHVLPTSDVVARFILENGACMKEWQMASRQRQPPILWARASSHYPRR